MSKKRKILSPQPTSVPVPNGWWVDDRVLAGPAFCGHSPLETAENLEALAAAGIGTIIGLASFTDFLSDGEFEAVLWDSVLGRFAYYGFAIPDGAAPDRETMQVILGWIGAGTALGKVYLNCVSGRGRSGTVAGCWLARQGRAQGEAVLDRLTQLRSAAGLSGPCPETQIQRDRVTHWRKGQ